MNSSKCDQKATWPYGEPEQRQVLCVSSGHIHESDIEILTHWAHNPFDKPLIVYDPDPGLPSWIAVATADVVDGDGQQVGVPDEISKECWHILVTAYKAGYDRVEFDGDAKVYTDLPFFSW